MSERARGNRSVGNKLSQLDSRVSRNSKRASTRVDPDTIDSTNLKANSVGQGAIEPNAVGPDEVAPGAIGSEHLGSIEEIGSNGSLALQLATDGKLLMAFGGTGTNRVLWSPTEGLDRGDFTTPSDWNTITAPGTYRVNFALATTWLQNTNYPTKSNTASGTLVVARSGFSITQVFYTWVGEVWQRTTFTSAGSWTTWDKMAGQAAENVVSRIALNDTNFPPGSDLNTLTEAGTYSVNYTTDAVWQGVLNAPPNAWRSGSLLVFLRAGYATQMYVPNSHTGGLWMRFSPNGSWTTWQHFTSEAATARPRVILTRGSVTTGGFFATPGAIPWDGWQGGYGDMKWDAANPTRLTFLQAGTYHVTYGIQGNGGPANTEIEVMPRLNGSDYAFGRGGASWPIGWPRVSAAFDINVTANQYLELVSKRYSGADIGIRNSDTFFAAHYIGPL